MGTQLLPPLQAILTKATHPKFPRQIFILTDGEVNNTEEVIAMTKKNIGMKEGRKGGGGREGEEGEIKRDSRGGREERHVKL